MNEILIDILEPITYDNLYELQEGEWIWDSKIVEKRDHGRHLNTPFIEEQIGFRQIQILDIDYFVKYGGQTFMLTTSNNYKNNIRTWEYFEPGRYFRFKR